MKIDWKTRVGGQGGQSRGAMLWAVLMRIKDLLGS